MQDFWSIARKTQEWQARYADPRPAPAHRSLGLVQIGGILLFVTIYLYPLIYSTFTAEKIPVLPGMLARYGRLGALFLYSARTISRYEYQVLEEDDRWRTLDRTEVSSLCVFGTVDRIDFLCALNVNSPREARMLDALAHYVARLPAARSASAFRLVACYYRPLPAAWSLLKAFRPLPKEDVLYVTVIGERKL